MPRVSKTCLSMQQEEDWMPHLLQRYVCEPHVKHEQTAARVARQICHKKFNDLGEAYSNRGYLHKNAEIKSMP